MMFWKRFFSIFSMLIIATLAACALYPFVNQAISHWTDWTYPPARIFRRIWMITVILGLLSASRFIGIRRPSQSGFSLSKTGFIHLGIGLCGVFLFLEILTLLYLWLGAWQVVDPIYSSKVQKRFVEGIFRGIVVSGLEEYIFRGLIFFSLCRTWSWKRAAIVCSLIFASLHFLEGRGNEILSNPSAWTAGFQICGMLLSNMANHFTLFPDAAGLFLVGMALCHGAWRTGSLWYGAALHGGWIWFFTVRGTLFEPSGSMSELWIGGNRIFNGIIPMLGMLLIFPATEWLIHHGILRSSSSPKSDENINIP